MTIRDKANINNLTALWSTVGLACGAYCSKTSYSFSTILNSQWPNRVWLNAPPNWGIINEILNSCGQNKLPKSLSYWADFGDPTFQFFDSSRFELKSQQVGMSLDISKKKYPAGERIKLQRITTDKQAILWEELYPKSFGYVISARTVAATMNAIDYFIIYHGQFPIGTVISFKTNSVVGIHGLGILPPYRKQGFAKQVMQELLNKAAEAHMHLATLQASAMGKMIYKDLGFSEDFLVRNYTIL